VRDFVATATEQTTWAHLLVVAVAVAVGGVVVVVVVVVFARSVATVSECVSVGVPACGLVCAPVPLCVEVVCSQTTLPVVVAVCVV
jgi:hypothetical protein